MSKILSLVSPNGDMTSFGYSAAPVVVGDQTIYTTTGTVPNPPPIPPVGPCKNKPNSAFWPVGQQQPFVMPAGQAPLTFLMPTDLPQGRVQITKKVDTPPSGWVKIWFSRCPGEFDDLSKQPGYSVQYNYNGGSLYYTYGEGDGQHMKIPVPCYANFTCSTAAPYWITQNH